MINDKFLPFAFPTLASKKITVPFDRGRITSDGGVIVLAQAERRLADKLAAVIADRRDPLRLVHRLSEILRACILAIGSASTSHSTCPADDCRIMRGPSRSQPCLAGRGVSSCTSPSLPLVHRPLSSGVSAPPSSPPPS